MPKRNDESVEQLKPRAARKRSVTAAESSLHQAANQAPHHLQSNGAASDTPLLDQVVTNLSLRTRARSAAITGQTEPDAYVVDLLPDFLIDHRSDLSAHRIPCGEVTGIEGIREEIQLRFVPKVGGGYFRIIARLNGKPTGLRWVEFVEALVEKAVRLMPDDQDEFDELDALDDDVEPMMTRRDFLREIENVRLKERLAAMERQIANPTLARSTPSLLDQLKELKAAQELLAPQSQQVKQSEPPTMTLEAVVAKLLLENPEQNATVVERIAARLLGDEEKDNGGIFQELVKNAPAIIGALFQGMQTFQIATPSATTPADVPSPMQPTAPPQMSAQTAPPSLFEQSYGHAMAVLIGSIAHNSPNRAAISAADYLIQNFPEGAAVEQFLNQDAQALAQMLASFSPEAAQAVNQPHSITFRDSQ